jgi:hypothetical protein
MRGDVTEGAQGMTVFDLPAEPDVSRAMTSDLAEAQPAQEA